MKGLVLAITGNLIFCCMYHPFSPPINPLVTDPLHLVCMAKIS